MVLSDLPLPFKLHDLLLKKINISLAVARVADRTDYWLKADYLVN